MNSKNQESTIHRIGFQYFPDTLHYKDSDLKEWLPELKTLGTRWLSLRASLKRAIPESFITGLKEEKIEAILNFNLPIDTRIDTKALVLLLGTYKKWGIKYISLFDRPNMKEEWGNASWTQQDLVERFLDTFLPLANIISGIGLTPVFPALEPGGDYWDTAFLRAALSGIEKRGFSDLLSKMVVGAYAWAGNQAFNWGAGGPESWTNTRPYFTPENEEDQLGFRIFDWYNAISEAVLNKKLPILILGCGSKIGDQQNPNYPAVDELSHSYRNLHIGRILSDQHQAMRDGASSDPIAKNILGACFSVLATEADHPEQKNAWYRADGTTLPVVQAFQSWMASKLNPLSLSKQNLDAESKDLDKIPTKNIEHYMLLSKEKFASKWKLDHLLPFINKYHPSVGYSLKDAGHAKRVSLIGNQKYFSKEFENGLIKNGCQVVRISGSGTSIATQLEKHEVNNAN